MKIVCLMDPLETINPKKDTSYAILKEAESLGHDIYFVDKHGISLDTRLEFPVVFNASKITANTTTTQALVETEATTPINESDFDICLIRTDPPVDENYINNTWFLDQCRHCRVLNSPSGIRNVNEKIWATQFSDIIPKTLISANLNELKNFIKYEGQVVIKPTNGFGGQSIFIIKKTDTNLNSLLETLTQNGNSSIICQEYLEDAQNGDKRILLLNGEPLGAVLRHHKGDDPRNNFFAGGEALKATVTKDDLKIIERIKPFLREQELFFVGIDIIGGKLIEINVTSPTCLQEMSELNQENLAKVIVEAF